MGIFHNAKDLSKPDRVLLELALIYKSIDPAAMEVLQAAESNVDYTKVKSPSRSVLLVPEFRNADPESQVTYLFLH